jgi:hypothetical protein
MVNEVREQTEDAIRQLREAGHLKEAQQLETALDSGSLDGATPDVESEGGLVDALPLTLREACQTVLTAIEAIDPNMEMLLEQLRAKIDNLLTPKHDHEVAKDL